MTSQVVIRPAIEADIASITDIYNHAVRTSTATFDMVEKTIEDRMQWFENHDDSHPVIVAEVDGRIAGWGSLSHFGERPGWRYTVENAVYVSPDFQGRGIGRMIMEQLVSDAGKLGHRAIIAQIVSGNDASIRLHEKLGFETVGVLKEAGNKFDQWLDVVLMEKLLDAAIG